MECLKVEDTYEDVNIVLSDELINMFIGGVFKLTEFKLLIKYGSISGSRYWSLDERYNDPIQFSEADLANELGITIKSVDNGFIGLEKKNVLQRSLSGKNKKCKGELIFNLDMEVWDV